MEIDPASREIHRAGGAVHLEPQAFDLLVLLIEHRDRVLAKTDLLDGVWGHRFRLRSEPDARVSRKRDGRSVTTALRSTPFTTSAAAAIASLRDSPTAIRPRRPLQSGSSGARRSSQRRGGAAHTAARDPVGAWRRRQDRTRSGDAQHQRNRRLDDGHFVDLSTLEPGADVLPAIALALSVSLDAARPATTVAAIAGSMRWSCSTTASTSSTAPPTSSNGCCPCQIAWFGSSRRVARGWASAGEWIHEIAPLDPTAALDLFAAASQRGASDLGASMASTARDWMRCSPSSIDSR